MTGTASNPIPIGQPGDSRYYAVGMVGKAMAALDQFTSVGFEAVIDFDGVVDVEALESAWSAVQAVHPILRRRRQGGVWELGNEDVGPAEMTILSTARGQRLVLACDHVAFDGLGSVMLLEDLRRFYVDATLEPQPDWTPRTFEQASGGSNLASDFAVASRAAFRWRRAVRSTHRDPSRQVPAGRSQSHYVMELGPTVAAFTEERRLHGWSTDALLIGILEQAWSEVFGRPSSESVWMVAQDLRQELGLQRGMGNLSLIDAVRVGGSVSGTAETATAQMRSQRSDLLHGAKLGAKYAAISAGVVGAALSRGRRLRYFRSLSNVGQLGDSLDDWGAAKAARIFFVGPMAHPPYTSFIAAGRGDSTLVSVRTSPDWLTDEQARRLEASALGLIG